MKKKGLIVSAIAGILSVVGLGQSVSAQTQNKVSISNITEESPLILTTHAQMSVGDATAEGFHCSHSSHASHASHSSHASHFSSY